MSNKGVLIVLSGPSGSGKGTVLKEYLPKNKNARVSVSATTRAPRPGEENHVHYHFVTREEFEKSIKEGEMLEYTEYCGNYYGTPKSEVYSNLEKCRDVILEIEVEGAKQIREKCCEAVLVFVVPPSMCELKDRLVGRHTEDEKTIKRRLETAAKELELAYTYDYIIVNDSVEKAAKRLEHIIESEKCRQVNMKKYIDEVLKNAKTIY